MKMLFFLIKSLSRIVHEEIPVHEQQQYETDHGGGVGGSGGGTCTSLTVWRKSLLISCNGFTVIDSKGNLIYRVDNYIGHPQEIILMDGSGKSVLTMHRRKKLGMIDSSWFVYKGEVGGFCRGKSSKTRPIFCIRKNINILINGNPNVLAYIYRNTSDKRSAYWIEGSYKNRSCKVLESESKKVVAETRKKEAISGGVSYGVEVFQLIVHPGFDSGFAMALVLLLDQMFS
ncbi:protein LURP-one-related 17 [Ziziphus jujuba]|uniref:Protein LURP-one-related 17 n=1 Tax=Ziziphus jujuba TaxID=326968 RepID=A0A6P6GKY0_ZIZJJ|nr:protein LURP-one-related 17 [Ziziphus jujuba]